MLLKDKIERALALNRERMIEKKRKEAESKGETFDESNYSFDHKGKIETEKGDFLAILIAGYYVFAPVFIIIILIALLVSLL